MSLSLPIDVLGKYKSDVFIETGTNLGGGIATALWVGFEEIHSIEVDENKYNKVRDLVQYNPNIHIHLGDSKDVLRVILQSPKLKNKKITFFLDAHSDDYNPLMYELNIIKNLPRNDHTILVDDRRVMGNPNYQCWKYITERNVLDVMREINSNYMIKYENSFNSLEDIIVAWIP